MSDPPLKEDYFIVKPNATTPLFAYTGVLPSKPQLLLAASFVRCYVVFVDEHC